MMSAWLPVWVDFCLLFCIIVQGLQINRLLKKIEMLEKESERTALRGPMTSSELERHLTLIKGDKDE